MSAPWREFDTIRVSPKTIKPATIAIDTSRASCQSLLISNQKQIATQIIETGIPAGTLNDDDSVNALRRRRIGNAAHVLAYTITLVITVIFTA